MSVKRHELFYWDLVTFQVDKTLFRVPKEPFVNGSTFFRDMFELPQGEGIVEGVDDEHPIHLPDGITKDEFATLVRALCASGSVLKDYSGLLSKDDWMCCLKLSTMWDMEDLRQLCIDRLSTTPSSSIAPKNFPIASHADRIALGIKYSVPQWIQEGAEALVRMKRLAVTKDEKNLLGTEATLYIYEIREEVREEWERLWVANQITCPQKHYTDGISKSISEDSLQAMFYCSHCGSFDINDIPQTKAFIHRAVAERFP